MTPEVRAFISGRACAPLRRHLMRCLVKFGVPMRLVSVD